ncbi:MAG: hypothetical protein HOC70_01850 [Gammaproteobacteria bacterium]|jgi:hypothetical protein|nr:hypothetical protein [Gammaproteobacteria bacterium]MBT4491959.1 hypothetical protein [Gammaproteobacteria bacterium]MBT7371924.1 hypothetical protein [Gammaproteobacteria bacterium]
MAFDKALQKKLLKKLKTYLSADADDLRKKDDGLSKVLKKLKKKESHLKKLAAAESDAGEREYLEQELEVVHSQRKKGIKLLAEVRDQKRR